VNASPRMREGLTYIRRNLQIRRYDERNGRLRPQHPFEEKRRRGRFAGRKGNDDRDGFGQLFESSAARFGAFR